MSELSKIKLGQVIVVGLSLICLFLVYFTGRALWLEADRVTNDSVNAEIQNIQAVIQSEIDDVIRDAGQLTLRETKNALIGSARNNPESLEFLQEQWKSLFDIYPTLQQIRFLERNGMERFRIDSTGSDTIWIEQESLQNKADRYYFMEALSVDEDVSLSQLDLNVENGVIEIPYRPTLRASGKYVYEGETIGVVVLNFDLRDKFEFLASQQEVLSHWLVNSSGYFINAPDNSSWGWLLGREDNHLRNRFPSLAGKPINEIEVADLSNEFSQQYAFKEIIVKSDSRISLATIEPKFWLIIQKPREALQQLTSYKNMILVAMVLSSLIMVGVVFALLRLISNLEDERKRARYAEQAKTQFLAHMSHEIRTPMNGIYGLLQITQGERDYKKINNNIEQAISSFSLLSKIIDDVLDFSKIEARKLEIDEKPFRLDTVLKQIGQMMGRAAYGKNIDLWIDLDPACPKSVVGDSVRLTQIITNLVSNAIKFTSRGEINFRIEVIGETASDIHIGFSVEDTGIGMTEEQCNTIFSAFTQASKNTSSRFGGTGLGLSIAKQLVELMDGEIGVTSEVGVGSVFQFHVKLKKPDVKALDAEIEQEFDAYQAIIFTKNVNAAAIMRRQCSVLGWPTIAVDNTPSLNDIKDAGKLPLVLLIDEAVIDFLDDKKLSEWRERHAQSINIVITSHNHRGYDDELLLVVDDVLTKPFTPSTLYDTVNGIASRSKRDLEAELPTQASSQILQDSLILVVEDNAINQHIAGSMLESAGATVKFAENGQECLDLLGSNMVKPDLILMDMQMPIMDGVTATIKIREIEKWDALPILAMTANALDSDKATCIDAGMQGHIAKPILKDTLINTVAQKLRG